MKKIPVVVFNVSKFCFGLPGVYKNSARAQQLEFRSLAHAYFKYVTGVKMAAHGDTNKPKCKTNVNNDEDRDFALVYKVKI